MSYALERLIDRFAQRSVAPDPLEVAAAGPCVVIRLARDEDMPLLHDLAELDSAEPLAGAESKPRFLRRRRQVVRAGAS